MLEKIIRIHNVTKFLSYNASGDTSFKDVTLIFGENGRGKSTIATILRSLTNNDPIGITAKKTTNATSDPLVEIRASNQNHKFENGNWNIPHPDIIVFDSHFVNSNIFSGDYVTSDHRKALYHLVIGDHGVQLAEHIITLDKAIRKSSQELQALSQSISNCMISPMDIGEFISLPIIENVDESINNQKQQIATLEQAEKILDRPIMEKISIPSVPLEDITQILSVDLEVISKEAEAAVLDHIRTLSEDAPLWIEQGLKYIDENELQDCPFCGLPLDDSHLIEHYKHFFTEEYNQLKSKVGDLQSSIKETFSQELIDTCSKSLSENRINNEFWQDHLSYQFSDISTEQLSSTINNLRLEVCKLLDQKLLSLLEKMEISEDVSKRIKEYQDLLNIVEELSKDLDEINKKIDKLKNDTDLSKLEEARKVLSRLLNSKKRHEQSVDENCNSYNNLTLQIENQRIEKDNTREQLDNYSVETLSQYQDNINRYLDISTDIQIDNIRTSYRGGRPRAEYQLLINNVPIPIGSDRVIDEASFTTTLSDGDRNSLAFAFFLAMLYGDPNLEEKIVIIDDPITSLDRNRRTCTCQELVHLSDNCKQLVIMSHDPFFLFDISSNVSSTKHLGIFRSESGSEITEWEISESVKMDFHRNLECLQKFSNDGSGNPRLVAQSIRPLLEGLLRIKYPDEFLPKEWLGDFIPKIDASSPGDALDHLMGDTSRELNDIKNYAKKFHHDQNTNCANEPINNTELESYVARTLQILKSL